MLKHGIKVVTIHFITFMNTKHLTKGLAPHQGHIRSYLQVKMRVCKNLDKDFTSVRILPVLDCVIRIEMLERHCAHMVGRYQYGCDGRRRRGRGCGAYIIMESVKRVFADRQAIYIG